VTERRGPATFAGRAEGEEGELPPIVQPRDRRLPPPGRDRHQGEAEMRTVIVLIALLVSSAAQAYFVTYQQWLAMQEAGRNAYIIGAFDGYLYDDSQFFVSEQWKIDATVHYEMCLSKARMSSGQLAANVMNFARDKPELHTQPVQHVLMNYLFAACGKSPTK
jgi:hypothetical protein